MMDALSELAKQFYLPQVRTSDGKYWMPLRRRSCAYPHAKEDAFKDAKLEGRMNGRPWQVLFFDGVTYHATFE